MKIKEKTIRYSVLRMLGAVLGGLVLFSASLAQAVTLADIEYSSLAENRMEIRLSFDGQPPEVKGYSIEKPARIALDMQGVRSGLNSKHHNLGTGNARSLTVVEARDRTRLIINQIQLTGYETSVDGNTLVVTLGEKKQETQPNLASGGQSETSGSEQATVTSDGSNAIEAVDFQRAEEDGGRVIVTLGNPSIPVDVRQEGGQVVAKFVGASLPEDLQRRLDVTDFATPVKYIDTKTDGRSAMMSIQATGNWEYMAYQADNKFTINVKPVSRTEESRRRKEAFEYTGEKLSLNFQDIEVRSVLQLIADFTDLNLVASDTVSGTITLRLQNVPWDQALDLILKTKGLDKRKIGNVLLVAPADEIAAREQLELESQKKIEALAPLRTEYIRVNYAKATSLEALIKKEGSLLSERGSITVDDRTNTLIIQDTEKKLDNINEVIATLDIPVQQVLIEARVVIANNDVSQEIGVRWGGLAFQGDRFAEDGRSLSASGDSINTREFGISAINGDDIEITEPNDMVVDMGVQSQSATRFSLGFVDVSSGILNLELSALESEGRSEIIASPKILTADQQPALIASGQQVAFEKATASGATAVEFIDAELSLEATPHITPDNQIIMEIRVNNDSVAEQVETADLTIDTNRLETTVLVGNGKTVVLGGIFQNTKSNSLIKTPFLGDLPWIGNLFRRKTSSDVKQELLIFITPRLVEDAVASN